MKGIVSRDFGGLQIILMNRLCVTDVLLEVYSFLNLHLHIVFLIFKFTAVYAFIKALSKSLVRLGTIRFPEAYY